MGAGFAQNSLVTSLADIQQAIAHKNFDLIVNFLTVDKFNFKFSPNYYSSLPFPYSVIFNSFAESKGHLSLENASKALNAFFKHLNDTFDGNLRELLVLKKLCHAVYLVAQRSRASSALEEAARQLSKAFTLTITDRNPLETSKKWATLYIVNLLFRIYFSLNNTRLCMNIIRAVENENQQFPPLTEFPKAEYVTWCWFRARNHFNDAAFELAIEPLTCAFEAFPQNVGGDLTFAKNKRLVLLYLIVAKMLSHGKVPNDWLLEAHDFAFLKPLCQAVRTGNLNAYLQQIQLYRKFFLQTELYLVLQVQMKQVIYRNLLRLTYSTYRKVSGIEGRLPIEVVVCAFLIVSPGNNDWNAEHVECISANLIAKGMVKGYISHEKQMIVLSKKDPFPHVE
jgi:hypothetical protein